jgi:hypothetical protein
MKTVETQCAKIIGDNNGDDEDDSDSFKMDDMVVTGLEKFLKRTEPLVIRALDKNAHQDIF